MIRLLILTMMVISVCGFQCNTSELLDDHSRLSPIILPNPTPPKPIVRAFYIEPADAPAGYDAYEGWSETIEARLRDVQTFYAIQMERHGFGWKTFQTQDNPDGSLDIQYVRALHTEAHYDVEHVKQYETGLQGGIAKEMHDAYYPDLGAIHVYFFNFPKHIACGYGSHGTHGRGTALVFRGDPNGVPIAHERKLVKMDCWAGWAVKHEIGHAFGLPHDWRNGEFIMSYGATMKPPDFTEILERPANPYSKLSYEAAAFLNEHPAFN